MQSDFTLLSPLKGSKTYPEEDDLEQRQSHPNSHFINYLDSSCPPSKYLQHYPFLDRITFLDMIPYVKRINESFKKFNFADMPLLDKGFNVEAKLIVLDSFWRQELKGPSPSFFRALYRTFQKEFRISCGFLLVDSLVRICPGLYIAKMVSIISSPDESAAGDIFSCALTLSALVLISFLVKNWSYYFANTRGGKARLVVSGMIYKKLNSISMTSVNEVNVGKIVNLIANELNEIETSAIFLSVMMFSPFMLALGTFIMWQYFGYSCLFGLGAIVLFVAGQVAVSNFTGAPRKENKALTDSRVKTTNEIIECIRLIKMYAWEKPFKDIVQNLRKKEIGTFTKISFIDGVGKNLSVLSIYVSILFICIAYTRFGGILSPDKVYATMIVLMFLGNFALLFTYFGFNALINFRLMFKRVQHILEIQDVLPLEQANQDQSYSNRLHKDTPIVEFRHFTAYWNQSSRSPCLSNLNVSIQPGSLTCVIGSIGSGKSSLLLSLLREIPVTHGYLNYSGKIAYVEQEPVIFSGSVRDNVLFGKRFDEKFYHHVIKACNLSRDLEIFSHGDLTVIGEKGANLSGGQRARISLARAIYSESDIYLFDDPFSAVDSKVARDIFNQVLKGDLLKDKTKVLVTHHLHFARESDYVVLMNQGSIQAQGTFSDIERESPALLSMFKADSGRPSMNLNTSEIIEEEDKEKEQATGKEQEQEKKVEVVIAIPEIKKEEESATVSWGTYKNYLTLQGKYRDLIIFGFLLVSFELIGIYYTKFIGYWALEHKNFFDEGTEDSEAQFDHTYYIKGSCAMLLILPVLNYIKLVKLNQFILSTNTELHTKMINALIKAKTLFFDINPAGSVLNRFSNDMGIMDKTNAVAVIDLVNGVTEILSLIVTVCVINPSVFIPVILIGLMLYKSALFFKKALIVTKKLELDSRGPLLSSLLSTMHGLTVIRVYNQGGRYVREFMDLVYSSARAFLFMAKTIRLLAILLDGAIHLFSISGIMAFAFATLYYQFEPGLVGLSLICFLRLGEKSNYILRQILYVDINMQSAQRMIEYTHLPSEAPSHIPKQDQLVQTQFQGKWPLRGDITFNNVYLRYQESLNFALNGLSFRIQGGTKVACVGRTGAGKSSIIQALFRMIEIEDSPDSYIKIDGVDTKSIGLNLLRTNISIIPQAQVVFTGTIRRNLDPFGKFTDDELWNSLEEVGLKEYVTSLENKLDTDMTLSSSVFSAGQKQLICMSRAILMNSNIIVLDEATANVDVNTDYLIQKTIKEKFANCTVVTIAHRLITIADYDKVIVMDNGKMIEYDSPYALLVDKIGDTWISKADSTFADMVRNTGKNMSKKILDVAKRKYFNEK